CLPALLPFLKSTHQLSYAAVATIVLAANVASSIVQPLFGYFADQTARRWILPTSVLLTGGGFALMGLAPGFAALLALVVAMGLLILVVTIRSWTTLGFTTFVPFYYIDTLGADPRLVGPLLFVFLGAGAAGTVIAGPLADRWRPRAFMQWVLLAVLPFGVLFLLARGA